MADVRSTGAGIKCLYCTYIYASNISNNGNPHRTMLDMMAASYV